MQQAVVIITCHTLTLFGLRKGHSNLELPFRVIPEDSVAQDLVNRMTLEDCGFNTFPKYQFSCDYGFTHIRVYHQNLVYFPPIRPSNEYSYFAWFPGNYPKRTNLQPMSFLPINKFRRLACSSE
jgi:hypothetical protein